MKRMFAAFVAAAILLLLAPAVPAAGPAPGATLADFAEQDLEGKPLSLASRKGKIVILNFWASWAPGCQAELPILQRTYENHHGRGVEIIGISNDKEKEALSRFVAEKKIPWPQFPDGPNGNKLFRQFGVDTIPTSILLDREGRVIGSDLRGPALEAAVEKALTNFDAFLANPRLWSLTQEEFARLPETAGFRWTSSVHDSARATNVSLSTVPVVEAVARFDKGKLVKIDASFYTRGDAGALPEVSLPALTKSARELLTRMTGDAKPEVRKQTTNVVNASGEIWRGRAAKFVLESSYTGTRAEFVRLVVVPPEAGRFEVVSPYNPNDKRFNGFFHVKKNLATGEVVIPDVPMVDQGEKGYCAVACAERVFRYFGRVADANEIAQLANSDPEKGTNGDAMFAEIKRLEGRLKVKVRPVDSITPDQIRDAYNSIATKKNLPRADFEPPKMVPIPNRPGAMMRVFDASSLFKSMDPQTLKEARTRKGADVPKFEANVRKYIDLGIPIIWGVQLGIFPEPQVPQSGGGHMRLIIGYSPKNKELIFTDSWGAGHEQKRMPLDNAMTITRALTVIEPL